MRRINTSTSINGRFRNGNKSTGTKATQFNAEWCNAVQEEICKLIEAAGLTVDGSEDQLKRIFTVLYVLDATLKSAAFRKTFPGGYSDAVISGEKLLMDAHGDSVTDLSSSELSRMGVFVNKPDGAGSGGASDVEITATGIVVKHTDQSNNVVKTEISYNEIKTITAYIEKLVGKPVSANKKAVVVDSNLVVGNPDDVSNGSDLNVLGKVSVKDFEFKTIHKATTSYFDLTSIEGTVGQIAVVHNTTSYSSKVRIINLFSAQIADPGVSLNPFSSCAFICTGSRKASPQASEVRYDWSPLSNDVIADLPSIL